MTKGEGKKFLTEADPVPLSTLASFRLGATTHTSVTLGNRIFSRLRKLLTTFGAATPSEFLL